MVEIGDSKYGRYEEWYNVFVGFDRCKIMEVFCICGNKDILWCVYVVVFLLF